MSVLWEKRVENKKCDGTRTIALSIQYRVTIINQLYGLILCLNVTTGG
jgi:hypothetical protein